MVWPEFSENTSASRWSLEKTREERECPLLDREVVLTLTALYYHKRKEALASLRSYMGYCLRRISIFYVTVLELSPTRAKSPLAICRQLVLTNRAAATLP